MDRKTTKPDRPKPRGRARQWGSQQLDALSQPDIKGADDLARAVGGLALDMWEAAEDNEGDNEQ